MSDQNKELVKRWFEEVWNKGRREAIAEMLSADAFIQRIDRPGRLLSVFRPDACRILRYPD